MATSTTKNESTEPARRSQPEPGSDGALTGIFITLCEEHAQMAALLNRALSSVDERSELWPTIRAELLSHERGEVRELYPVLRAKAQTRALADLHDDEAKDLEGMILDLDLLPVQSDEWTTLFEQLSDAVLEHAEEEETMIFPKAQAALGEPVTLEIDTRFADCKAKLFPAV